MFMSFIVVFILFFYYHVLFRSEYEIKDYMEIIEEIPF